MKLTTQEQAEYDILAAGMDAREEPFRLVREFEKKHGFVPAQYQIDVKFFANYETYKRVGSWRNDKAASALVEKSAREIARRKRRKHET